MEVGDIFKNSNMQSMFAQLGNFVANEYVPSDDCNIILMHIYEQLNKKDQNSRHFRQVIGLSQVLKKDLLPMLLAVNNNKTLEILVKILGSIMLPIECLIPASQRTNDEIGFATILNLNWALATSKVACANINTIRRIIQIIKESSIKLSKAKGNSKHFHVIICDCLRFIKHILHTPNDQSQNQILWMLFSEHFDEVLIDLIDSSGRAQWAILIIELIALIFKNQHVDHLSKLLSKTVISDSSEDNESNTSTHPKNGTCSLQESSYGSDSEDNDIDRNLKVARVNDKQCKVWIDKQDKKKSNSSEHHSIVHFVNAENNTKSLLKDTSILHENHCVQKRNNKEESKSRNTSAEQQYDDKIYKTISINPISNRKIKLRMKKFTKKKSKTKLNLPTSANQVPIEVCITHFLQKFTIRFIRNGFNTLVAEVYTLLKTNSQLNIDSSPYFWILTYFCRFCKLDGIELNSIRRILSFELISFSVHEGLKISEQLMIAKRQKSHDIHLRVRHLHLVIMSIKELVQIIQFYLLNSASSPIYSELIKNLKSNNWPESIIWAKDLMSIFLLCIRHYDSNIQAIEYLHDLIVTNHIVLSLFDNIKLCWNLNDSITTHIKKFAAPDIMFNYGIVLQNYKENNELVNDAVLTMMHHIVGEMENTTVLFQPIIFKTFLSLYIKKDYLYKKWSDLIEYVIV